MIDISVVNALIDAAATASPVQGFIPFGEGVRALRAVLTRRSGASEGTEPSAAGLKLTDEQMPPDYPQTMAELGELSSYTYDLSTKAAGDLKIPVIGSVAGGINRRVVVYEWTRYKDVTAADGTIYRYGYAIRFCLTVSDWNAKANMSLSFLSAQAEIGSIQASWLMQVRGLTGKKIDEVVLPPQDLNVKTFVIAQQSLTNVIAAINDQTTQFVPGVILGKIAPGDMESKYRESAVAAFAVYSVSRGRRRADALSRLGAADAALQQVVADVYEAFDIKDGVTEPSAGARDRAREILMSIKADT